MTINDNFRQRRWGSSLPGQSTRDLPLDPRSTVAEIFRHTWYNSRKKNNKKWNNYQKQWPPSFMPEAKGSARTPLGPKFIVCLLYISKVPNLRNYCDYPPILIGVVCGLDTIFFKTQYFEQIYREKKNMICWAFYGPPFMSHF